MRWNGGEEQNLFFGANFLRRRQAKAWMEGRTIVQLFFFFYRLFGMYRVVVNDQSLHLLLIMIMIMIISTKQQAVLIYVLSHLLILIIVKNFWACMLFCRLQLQSSSSSMYCIYLFSSPFLSIYRVMVLSPFCIRFWDDQKC